MVVFGTIIFIISDLTIAVNKFVYPNDSWKFLIKFTYLMGQNLIIHGFIEGNKKSEYKIE